MDRIRERDAYWYWIVVVFIGVTTVCGNTVVIYLILTRRCLHITANWFILSLSFADLLVGLVVIPTYIIHTFWVQLNLHALLKFYNLILYVSVGNLCVMTGDRYLAITRPLNYVSLMTRSKVLIMIFTAWSIPAGISLLSLLWQTSDTNGKTDTVHRVYGGLTVVCFEVIPCLMMLLVYFHLYLITRAHSRRIAAQESVKERHSGEKFTKRRRQRNRERSNLKVFASVALLFVFCWLLSAYRGFCHVFSLCSVTIEFVQVSRILIFLNSAVNVVVYSFLKRDIRTELKRLLRCRTRQESLDFSLVRIQESTVANRSLEVETEAPKNGQQEPGPSVN
ncbi:histamine H2 receptor-like [Oculina patagonica]